MASPTYNPRYPTLFGSTLLLSSAGVLETAMTTDPVIDSGEAWGRWEARRVRYRIFWGLYEQNIFARVHELSRALKDHYDLYDSIRSVYAPSNLIGGFWSEHLYPGQIDMEAGDGSNVISGCPIVTDNERVRLSLKTLWRDSHIGDELEVYSRYGAVMGDTFLKVVDDPYRKRVYLQAVHPGTVREYYHDPADNCRGYVIERMEPDPEHDDPNSEPKLVPYVEIATRQGDSVVMSTYRDGEPYDWRQYEPGQPKVGWQWSEPYGFVPLVRVRHRLHAAGWGAGEYQFSLSKLLELDSLASRLCDQIYKITRCPVYLEGGEMGDDINMGVSSDGEDAYPMLAGPGKPHFLVAPLNIDHTVTWIKDVLLKLEEDHPELIADHVGASSSGEARRVARDKAEARVIRRRSNYDSGLIRAQQMAMSMGGLGGYEDYSWVTPESYNNGDLDHAIGERAVFSTSELSRLEEEEQRGKTLKSLTDAGVPLRLAMGRAGFTEEDIGAAQREKDKDARDAVERARSLGFSDGGNANQDEGQDDDGEPGNGNPAPNQTVNGGDSA